MSHPVVVHRRLSTFVSQGGEFPLYVVPPSVTFFLEESRTLPFFPYRGVTPTGMTL